MKKEELKSAEMNFEKLEVSVRPASLRIGETRSESVKTT